MRDAYSGRSGRAPTREVAPPAFSPL